MSFADNIVIFGKADLPNVWNMIQTVEWFYEVSGQKINFIKSQVIHVESLSNDVKLKPIDLGTNNGAIQIEKLET